MNIVIFKLSSLRAMWRDYRVASNDFSAALPSPTMIAGIVGNAQGMDYDPIVAYNTGNPIPYAKSLKKWVEEEQVAVAVRFLDDKIKRCHVDGNRTKVLDNKAKVAPTQIPRSFLWKPSYEIAVKLISEDAAVRLAESLKNPKRRVFAGDSSCPAFIAEVRIINHLPLGNWAVRSDRCEREVIPLTRMKKQDKDERMVLDGYWGLPTEEEPDTEGNDCFVNVMEE